MELISLAPGFSQVAAAVIDPGTVSTVYSETVETVRVAWSIVITALKCGVNEISSWLHDLTYRLAKWEAIA